MTFSQVQWIGRYAKPENAFHEFVKKLFFHAYPNVWRQDEIMGATAWWNIRPSNPKPHNDRISYCTVDGVDYTPKDIPKQTFIYYLRAPDKGGRLDIYTQPPITDVKIGKEQFFSWADHQTDCVAPINNRLISFPFDVIHQSASLTRAIGYLLVLSFGISYLPTMERQTQWSIRVMIGHGKSNRTKQVLENLLNNPYYKEKRTNEPLL